MRRTTTILSLLAVLAFPCSADDDGDAEIILDFSGLVPEAVYAVEMSGVSMLGPVTMTPADAEITVHVAADSSELRLETAEGFGQDEAGGAARIAFRAATVRDVAISLDFSQGADLEIRGIPWPDGDPDRALPGPRSSDALPPTCVAEPACSPRDTKCPPRYKCYLCGSFCKEQTWLCCQNGPLPPGGG